MGTPSARAVEGTPLVPSVPEGKQVRSFFGIPLDGCTYTGHTRCMTDNEKTTTTVPAHWVTAAARFETESLEHFAVAEDRDYYDSLHDSIPSDIPDTAWESDGASKGAGA